MTVLSTFHPFQLQRMTWIWLCLLKLTLESNRGQVIKFSYIQTIDNYCTRLSKMLWFASGNRSIIFRSCQRLRQIIDLLTIIPVNLFWVLGMTFLSWERQDLEDNLNTSKKSVLSFNHLVYFHIYITTQLQ